MSDRVIAAIAAPILGAILATPLRTRDLRRVVRNVLGIGAAGAAVWALPDVDLLARLFVLAISFVSPIALAFSTTIFPTRERVDSGWSTRPVYYILFGAFWSSMLFTVCSTTLSGIWIGISATTLATTFLVGFSGGKSALEAAWKYLILCSFGIAIALLGMLLLGRAAMMAGLSSADALSWSALAGSAAHLPLDLTRVALLLIALGFATKAGLVPMHAWLPDAHSKAPGSVSALLSGLLVSCALYAIARVQGIAIHVAPDVFNTVLLVLAGASIVIGTVLMLSQRDLKRLLSYSTIEHSGMVALALALGTPLGFFAAIFHVLNHAAAKSLAFLAAGMVQYERGTTTIGALRGLFRSPSGKLLLVAMAGLAGFPPFGLFVSELVVVIAAVSARNWTAVTLASLGLMIGFVALARVAIETQPGGHARHTTPRLAVVAAVCLVLAMLAGALVPFLPLNTVTIGAVMR